MLIFIAMAISLTKNDFIFGSYIFSKLGISSWSNGATGLYFPGLVSITLFIIGFIDVMILTKGINKKFILVFISIVVFWKIIAIPAFEFGYDKVKENMNGLATIEYLRQDSRLSYETKDNKLSVTGQINLQNYSKEIKEFYIKVKPDKAAYKFGVPNELTALDEKDNPIKYILEPKTTCTLNILFKEISVININSSGMCGMDLVLYTENEEKEFINKYH